MAVTLAESIKRESDVEFNQSYFWSDSQTVLKYIRSESGRFLRFVENRVNFIHEHLNVCDWRFVPGNLNVADVGSRGVTVCKFITMIEWVKGPKFLYDSELRMFEEPVDKLEELEIESMVTGTISNHAFDGLLHSCSNWKRIRFRVAVYKK